MGIRTVIAMALFIGVAGLSACSDDSTPATATIQNSGMSPTALTVSAFDKIDYVNADSRPHQIVSSDCAELSSDRIAAGETVTVFTGQGPKTCHIADVLAPSNVQFRATVDVLPAAKNPSDNG